MILGTIESWLALKELMACPASSPKVVKPAAGGTSYGCFLLWHYTQELRDRARPVHLIRCCKIEAAAEMVHNTSATVLA
ncbi:MAG: hypothetical protein WBQ34_02885 [Candidatus Acidiferrales bacterium]